jgi:hypothetical protein
VGNNCVWLPDCTNSATIRLLCFSKSF